MPTSGQPVAITIEATPEGMTIRCAYTGEIESIPDAVKRMQDAGILQLVGAPAVEQPAISEQAIIDRVTHALEGSSGQESVKIAVAAQMLGGLDESTVRRYAKQGRLLIIGS